MVCKGFAIPKRHSSQAVRALFFMLIGRIIKKW